MSGANRSKIFMLWCFMMCAGLMLGGGLYLVLVKTPQQRAAQYFALAPSQNADAPSAVLQALALYPFDQKFWSALPIAAEVKNKSALQTEIEQIVQPLQKIHPEPPS
jgi:hypothetical protein